MLLVTQWYNNLFQLIQEFQTKQKQMTGVDRWQKQTEKEQVNLCHCSIDTKGQKWFYDLAPNVYPSFGWSFFVFTYV